MKTLLAVVAILLCLILIQPTPAEVVVEKHVIAQPLPAPTTSTVLVPYQVATTETFWQESEEYYLWRTSIKVDIEDAISSFPSTSGRWVTRQRFVTRYRLERRSIDD